MADSNKEVRFFAIDTTLYNLNYIKKIECDYKVCKFYMDNGQGEDKILYCKKDGGCYNKIMNFIDLHKTT